MHLPTSNTSVYDVPYTTVYITPPRGGFSNSIARQPRVCQYRTIRLRNVLGENADPFWHRNYSNCGDIERGKSYTVGCQNPTNLM